MGGGGGEGLLVYNGDEKGTSEGCFGGMKIHTKNKTFLGDVRF